ncbi:hypothetical protein GCM10010844_43390 [Deinococcus radiotolerans]|uniref:Lipoprotein n=1 Tax=Deinococcus radiotolerans TaxID=1309407 RepID=A0ABQ2FRH5_9DEIO|nr:hypothetical protein GCM10010844_43390 [Deinococcus radiotolerans]
MALALCSLLSCSPSRVPATSPLTPLGLVEVSFDGLGGAQPTTQVRTLSLAESAGGLDLSPQSVSVTDVGARNSGGTRYITATYRVRNASSDGTPSGAARSNLTLLAAAVPSNVDGTAISQMLTFSGAAAPTGTARTAMPTHALEYSALDGKVMPATGGTDLQVFTESEVLPGNFTGAGGPASSYADLGVTTVFPYGYVVHTLGGGRTLPASPAVNQYNGRVALSVRMPLQPDDAAQTPTQGAQRDPWSFRMTFLVVQDPDTRVTQSLEDQTLPDSVILGRAAAAGAGSVNILPGSAYASGATLPPRTICQVRTAGQVGSGATYLVNSCL